jgi:hypothetical protein
MKKIFRIETFRVGYQAYLLPTLKITHSWLLSGSIGIELIWLKWGVSAEIQKVKEQ